MRLRPLAAIVAFAVVAACKYPVLAPLGSGDGGGGDAPLPPGSPMLAAIEPSVAPVGTTITLEGTFVAPLSVNFPGGATAPATMLGPHRATAIVPTTATTGDLTVTAGTVVTHALPFRTTPFAPKLASFHPTFDQADAARAAPLLTNSRAGAFTVVTGGYLYVIGGSASGGFVEVVDSAMIDADGTLGPFTKQNGVTLTNPRAGAVAAVAAGFVYVVGGTGSGGPTNTVERAQIQADGSLGTFALVSGVSLATARTDAASAIIGDSLYVIGGTGATGPLASIESAVIDPDGTLEPFTAVTGALTTARAGAAAVASGGTLYVLGGNTASGVKSSIESAAIQPDGTLGAFALTTGVTMTSARAYFTTAVLGTSLYVIGGTGPSSADVTTIESATLAPDGTLSSFALAAGEQVTTARHAAASALVRDYVFLFGGSIGTGELATVERAGIDNNGALGTFATQSTVMLSASLFEGASVTIGDHLYLIGGGDLDTLQPVETVDQAIVQPDGTLGAFSVLPNVGLTAPRLGPMAAVSGGYLYVMGGLDTTQTNIGLSSIERAQINADGTLGTFQAYGASHLVIGRAYATTAIIGNSIYVFGGQGNGFAANSSVEEAPIDPTDGSIGAFGTSTIRLGFNHTQATNVVLGGWCYILGGTDGTTSIKVFERAPIQSSGMLGQIVYQLDTNGNQMYMSTERAVLTSAVVGDHLYLIGGANNVGNPSDPGLVSVDHSTLSTDGSVGGFSILTGTTLPEGIYFHFGAKASNYVYVLGGGSHTSTTVPHEVQQALLR